MSEAPAADPGCPDEATIAEFVQGELSGEPAERLEAHLDGCEACSQVVTELVRIFDEPSSDAIEAASDERLRSAELAVTIGGDGAALESMPSPLGPMLSAGAEVGRYRVLECVGVGGMGVVYAAYDPELDRRVALKLLRGARDEPGTQSRSARLLREAQALAKLSHPNVITVHDVGTWEDQVFVAMEFVDGMSLEEWMAQEPQGWRGIRDVFVAAGRGLAAAHEAGMVHRDFKPDNVLIGNDGRVRVTDFGLARWGGEARPSEDLFATDEQRSAELSRVSSEMASAARNHLMSLTETGTLIGTPAYMAPEQYAHRGADAASDQFAFCVAMYEAIHGERPFGGRTLAELASNVMDGQLPDASSPGIAVPRAVRAALRRGLSRRPSERFASMDELLAVLDHRPARRWRSRLWLGVGVGLPVAMLGAGLWAYGGGQEPSVSAFCADDAGLAEQWNESRAETIERAFFATELPYAKQTADRALAGVDAYVTDWEGLRQRSCRADARTDEGLGVAMLRQRCLQRHRVALEVLLETFDGADGSTVARAVSTVAGLPELDRCAETETLMAELPPPVPPDLRDAVEGVRDELARVRGLLAAGRYDEALTLARELDARAESLGHRPVQAEARFLVALMLDLEGESEAAYEAFEEAALLATASRHRRILARALVQQVYVLGVSLPHMDEADRVARRAEAELEAAGMGGETLSALLLNMGSVAYRRADYDTASRLCQRALELRDREQDPLRWADVAFNLASIDVMRGEEARGIERIHDYLEVFEAELGSMHPEVASGYQNLGVAYLNAGQISEAKEALEHAEQARRLTLGVDHPEYGSTLNMLGSVAVVQGRLQDGLRYIRQGIEVQEAADVDQTDIAVNRNNLAD
ncbi:MAG: protein kinase, partial [Nannocystaceae bacterium]